MAARRAVSVNKLIRSQKVRRRRRGPRFAGGVIGFFALTIKIFFSLVLLCAVALFGFTLYRFAFLSDYFELKQLVITGDVSEQVESELRALTQLEPGRGINLLRIDSEKVRETVLKHPRIKSASVKKYYPNVLVIRARERKPAAVVACEDLYLVDREGYVLDRVPNLERGQETLPFITGVPKEEIVFGQKIPGETVERALDLYECLRTSSPRLAEKLSEIRLNRDGGLALVLSGGVEVRLGREGFAERLAKLDYFVRKRSLEDLEYIDLRFKNQIVYRPRRG